MTQNSTSSDARLENPNDNQPSAAAVGELVDAVKALGERARFLAVNLAVIAAKLKQQGMGRTRLNDDILDLVARVTRVSQDVAEAVVAIERGRANAGASASLPHTQWEELGIPDERTLDRLTRSLQETLELSRHVFRWVRDTYPPNPAVSPEREKPGMTWAQDKLDGQADSSTHD